MKYGIYIGATKETITEAKTAVLEVLASPHTDEKTKQMALKAFSQAVSVKNCSISNTHVVGDQVMTDDNNDFDGEVD